MNTLKKVLDIFKIDLWVTTVIKLPIEVPNYGRANMAELFKELGFKVGVEIGVRGGDYSLVLMEANPELNLFGVDPYEPHEGYKDIQRKSSFDNYEKDAFTKLAPYVADGRYKFIKKYSKDALNLFPDNSIDFVYIDGDHCFEEVTFDIANWSKKVKKGGIVSGDDYFKHKGHSHIHVYEAVNGYTQAWQIRPWFVLGSKAIIEGEIRDHGRSWMWVKE